MKIAIILHLFYQDLWKEFQQYLSNLSDYDCDLYISLCDEHENTNISQTILAIYPNANIYVLPNRGADVGPFFVIFNDIINNKNINYDYILKIHTKKSLRKRNLSIGEEWRKKCILPLVGTKETVQNNIKLLQDNSIGILGSRSQLNDPPKIKKLNLHHWIKEGEKYQKYLIEKFCLPPIKDATFIAGTMFFAKFDPLKKYISNYQLPQEYFPKGNHAKGNTEAHAGERLFCKFFLAENLKVVGV